MVLSPEPLGLEKVFTTDLEGAGLSRSWQVCAGLVPGRDCLINALKPPRLEAGYLEPGADSA
jgi:hypothetical protein